MIYRNKEYLYDEGRLKEEIKAHLTRSSIINEPASRPSVTLNFGRAQNELRLSNSIFNISGDANLKKALNLRQEDTFYSQTISHAYYAMFFATQALLITQGLRTRPPNIHKATLDAFAYHFIITGKIDIKLFELYHSSLIKADNLLGLFVTEQEKRSEFTYKTISQSNIEPAQESITHAEEFLTHINMMLKSIE